MLPTASYDHVETSMTAGIMLNRDTQRAGERDLEIDEPRPRVQVTGLALVGGCGGGIALTGAETNPLCPPRCLVGIVY